MSSQILLSGGDKWYSYSGTIFGDVSVPASITLVLIPNIGLRDSYIKISPYFGTHVSNATGSSLGISILIDGIEVVRGRQFLVPTANSTYNISWANLETELFVPRQSKLEILSLNTSANNTQTRGCTLIGYYL